MRPSLLRSRRSLTITVAVAVVAVFASSAAAMATFGAFTTNTANSVGAQRMNAGNQPTFVLSGRDVTVNWAASKLSDATTSAQNYTIAKANTTPGSLSAALGGSSCTAPVSALTCTDTGLLENGTSSTVWTYTDTPHYASWNGPASTAGTLTVPAPSESLTATSFTADGGSTTASVANFFDNENVHFCLDGDNTSFTCTGIQIGSAAVAAAGGAASGTITIAAGTSVGSHTVYAIGDGGSKPTGVSITVTAGAASKLVFTTQPGSDSGSGAFSPQPQVSVEDAHGNVETSDNATTVTLAINTGTGTLNCTNTNGATVVVSQGVASGYTCAITQAGTGDKLQATSTPAHGTVVSNAFNVTISTPTITFPTSSSKESVPNNSTATFTITGTNFAPGVKVSISGNSFTSTSWTWTDTSHISVTTTAKNGVGNKGTFNLTVTNPDNGAITSTGSMVNA